MPTDTEHVTDGAEYGRGFYLELPSGRAYRARGELSITEQSTIAPRCPYCGTLESVKDHTDTCPVGDLEARTPSDPASVDASEEAMEAVNQALSNPQSVMLHSWREIRRAWRDVTAALATLQRENADLRAGAGAGARLEAECDWLAGTLADNSDPLHFGTVARTRRLKREYRAAAMYSTDNGWNHAADAYAALAPQPKTAEDGDAL